MISKSLMRKLAETINSKKSNFSGILTNFLVLLNITHIFTATVYTKKIPFDIVLKRSFSINSDFELKVRIYWYFQYLQYGECLTHNFSYSKGILLAADDVSDASNCF